MTKVNVQNWSQLDFLINNFYEIVEYKRGRGVYGDRVILKRAKTAEAILGEAGRLFEFYYMDANAVKELPRTVQEKINIITRFVTTPELMNVLCKFEKTNGKEPSEWALETQKIFNELHTQDFKQLNDILLLRYKELSEDFKNLINEHRKKQYFLASSDGFEFITKEHAENQLKLL